MAVVSYGKSKLSEEDWVIMQRVMEFLPAADLARASGVNRMWNELIVTITPVVISQVRLIFPNLTHFFSQVKADQHEGRNSKKPKPSLKLLNDAVSTAERDNSKRIQKKLQSELNKKNYKKAFALLPAADTTEGYTSIISALDAEGKTIEQQKKIGQIFLKGVVLTSWEIVVDSMDLIKRAGLLEHAGIKKYKPSGIPSPL